MAMRNSQTRLAKNGMASLMAEQERLLDDLVTEMNRQKGAKTRDDVLMEVVRNMESRMEEVRWPAKLQNRMDDVEQEIGEIDPIVAKRIEERKRAVKKPHNAVGIDGQMNGGVYNGNVMDHYGNEYDSVDALGAKIRKENMEIQRRSQLDKDEEYEQAIMREQSRQERKKEKKRRKTPEEEPVVPDPSVLAYVFNPFRMMQWDIPNVGKYQQEVEALERLRIEKEKEAKMASDAAAVVLNANQKRNAQIQEDAVERKGARMSTRKQTTKLQRGNSKVMNRMGSRDKVDEGRRRDSSRRKREPTKFIKQPNRKSPALTPTKKGKTFSQHTRGISGSGVSGRASSKPRIDGEEVGRDPDDEDSEPRASKIKSRADDSQEDVGGSRNRRMNRIDTVQTNFDGDDDNTNNMGSKNTFQRGSS